MNQQTNYVTISRTYLPAGARQAQQITYNLKIGNKNMEECVCNHTNTKTNTNTNTGTSRNTYTNTNTNQQTKYVIILRT